MASKLGASERGQITYVVMKKYPLKVFMLLRFTVIYGPVVRVFHHNDCLELVGRSDAPSLEATEL